MFYFCIIILGGIGLKSDKSVEEKEIANQTENGKLSRWAVFGFVAISALLMVLYVDNVKRVDIILKELQEIKLKKEHLKNENEMLKTRLNYLQSPERIMRIAEENMGMIKIDSAPEILPED